jgi:hypothetical protein
MRFAIPRCSSRWLRRGYLRVRFCEGWQLKVGCHYLRTKVTTAPSRKPAAKAPLPASRPISQGRHHIYPSLVCEPLACAHHQIADRRVCAGVTPITAISS